MAEDSDFFDRLIIHTLDRKSKPRVILKEG